MLPTPLSALIGVLFVLLAVGAVWLMFDGSRSAPQSDRARRMIRAHRVAGYLFIALFCIMTWFMILKIKDRPDELPAPSMLHALIAVVMAPLLFIKVLVARYYRNHTSILVPLGLTIFVLAFVLVTTTAGPYFLRTATVKNISLQAIDMGVAKIDLQASEALMQRRCSRCHNLDRVVGAKKDARGWLATVDRMRGLPGSGISESDEKIILSYLLSEDSINSSSAQGELVIGKAMVDSHCNRCHALDRTYQTVKTASEWNSTVTRMVNYAKGAEGFFKPGEADRIVQFLSATQTAEARSSPPIASDAVDRSAAQTVAKVALSLRQPAYDWRAGCGVRRLWTDAVASKQAKRCDRQDRGSCITDSTCQQDAAAATGAHGAADAGLHQPPVSSGGRQHAASQTRTVPHIRLASQR